jgi:hypothetical protein
VPVCRLEIYLWKTCGRDFQAAEADAKHFPVFRSPDVVRDYLSQLNGGADVIALRVEKVHAAEFADPKWARLMEMKQRDSHTQRKKSRSERNRAHSVHL